MGRNWETLSSKCTGVLLPSFRENLPEMPHKNKAKIPCTCGCVNFPLRCTKQKDVLKMTCFRAKKRLSPTRAPWSPCSTFLLPCSHPDTLGGMLLGALSSIACWRAGDDCGCEERQRGWQFGGSLGVWEKHFRNSATFLLKWSGEVSYSSIKLALTAYQVNVRGI